MFFFEGPYYKFKVYMDMINGNATKIEVMQPMLRRLSWIPFIGVAFLVLTQFFKTLVSTSSKCNWYIYY